MPFFNHLPELIVVLLIGLLVFGPKRMIEMGSSLGRTFRELRESVKDIPSMTGVNNLGDLLKEGETPRRNPLANASQFAQSMHIAAKEEPTDAGPASAATTTQTGATSNSAPHVVEGEVHSVTEHSED